MYVWNHYGNVLVVIVVVNSTVVNVVIRLNVHRTWFIVSVVFVLKILL